MTAEKLMTTEDAAKILNCSIWMVRLYIRTGQLGAFRYAGSTNAPYRVSQRHLDEFLQGREAHPHEALQGSVGTPSAQAA